METTSSEILKKILLGINASNTITSLSLETGLSRVGVYKVIKKLEKEGLLLLKKIGNGKTNAYSISLIIDNPLIARRLSLIIALDAEKQKRWIISLAELSKKADFLVLYGSILHSPKDANDIDILIVANKSRFIEIDKSIVQIQKTTAKKIHAIYFTKNELKYEIKKPNAAIIDAIKKGKILYGQDDFIKFIQSLK
ncbi:MAG: hypothetical protein V1859_05840 [archaeon]